MGVVWLAEREDAGNLVAIKFLPHAGLSRARRERFASEIKTLAKLKHPYIARLYDGACPDGTPLVCHGVCAGRFVYGLLPSGGEPGRRAIASLSQGV